MRWFSRGYLPHLDSPGLIQAVTFRLADAVPLRLIARWREQLAVRAGGEWDATAESERRVTSELHRKILRYEDAGHGRCELSDPDCAEIVAGAVRFFAGRRYDLLEWCIMPNHVHVLLRQRAGHRLPDVIRSWKSFSSREINRLLKRSGTLWARDYYDRFIRDEGHLLRARSYIHQNPVKAGLCATPADWPWSSAHGPPASIAGTVARRSGR